MRSSSDIKIRRITRFAPLKSLVSVFRSTRLIRKSHLVLIVATILLVQGCTNSKLIISPLYNRLDDRMRDAFNELGEFNEEQTAAVEATLGTFHVWHRQSELPQYAELLGSVAQSVARGDTDKQTIQQWFDAAEQHSVAIRQCHPVNFSFNFIKSLTDEQVDVLEKGFQEEYREDVERYAKRTPEERVQRRLRNITKWANRIDMEITATQRAMLLSTFKRQSSLRKQYFKLREEWDRKFFSLTRDRNNPEFDNKMGEHLNTLWRLLEDAHPEQWQSNRELWKQTGLRFVNSMTDEQRVTISQWMSKMGSTLVAISRDKPSFTVRDDPSLGCLVAQEES